MTQVACHGGYTQIGQGSDAMPAPRPRRRKVNALVYVGDAMEENIDDLAGRAGELALLGVPVFLFQEGHDAADDARIRGDRAPDQGRHVPLRRRLGEPSCASFSQPLPSTPPAGRKALRLDRPRRIGWRAPALGQLKP